MMTPMRPSHLRAMLSITPAIAAGGTLEVTIHADPPPAEIPAWSFLALAAIAVLGVALVALRRSDRQLPD